MPRRPRGPHSPSAMPLRERSKRLVVQQQEQARNLRLNPPTPFANEARSRNSATSLTGAADDFSVTPRRRSGQDRRAPVVLTREVIESYFSMPLSAASKDLGLCATAIKKVCRKMGIAKWPFRDRLLAAKHEEEQAKEAALRVGSFFGDEELDELAQQRVIADMLVGVELDDEEGLTSAADTPRVVVLPPGGDHAPPAEGPMSESSEGSVVDSASCDASVCAASPAEDDSEPVDVRVLAPAATAGIVRPEDPKLAAAPRPHPAQVPAIPPKPTTPSFARVAAPSCARVGFGGIELPVARDAAAPFSAPTVETCAYPADSLLGDLPMGDAGVFDGCVGDVECGLYLD